VSLTRLVIARPLLTTMTYAAVALLGLVAALRLPLAQLPDVEYPAVVVAFEYPGADPLTVQQQITLPVERAVAGVGGLDQVTGASLTGLSRVLVQFVPGTDVDRAASEVSQAVTRTQRDLPAGIEAPVVSTVNPLATPLLVIHVTGDMAAGQLDDLVTDEFLPRLQTVEGVGATSVAGGRTRVSDVVADPAALAARGLTVTQLAQALEAQNVVVPGGSAAAGGIDTVVTTDNRASTTADLRDLVVGTVGGAPVRLSEVASVTDGIAPPGTVSAVNGTPTVSVQVRAAPGANEVAAAAAVTAALDGELGDVLPDGVTARITSDSSGYTRAALSATAQDLILAILLAGAVILAFLQSVRQTLIVLVAIPCALLTTALVIWAVGFTLNIVTLLALSLVIGILVDDAVVVLENITRHLRSGLSRTEAAHRGRTEIGAAAVALTLTDVVVFAPLAFASGTVVGPIAAEFGLTIVATTLVSLLVSFTLTPMLASRWLRRPAPAGPLAATGPRGRGRRGAAAATAARALDAMTRVYTRLLRGSLRHRGAVLATAALTLVASVALVAAGAVGTEATPVEDSGTLQVDADMPPGTTLSATAGALDRLQEEIRREIPGVTDVVTTAGGAPIQALGDDEGTVTVELVDKTERDLGIEEVADRIVDLAGSVPGLSVTTVVPNPLSPPAASGIQIVVRGPDPVTVEEVAAQAEAAVAGVPGLARVSSTVSRTAPALTVEVDEAEAARYGLTAATVGRAVAVAVGGTSVTTVQTGTGDVLPVRVSVPGTGDLDMDALLGLPVAVAAPEATAPGSDQGTDPGTAGAPAGVTVTLGQVATVARAQAAVRVDDLDQLPQVTVTAATAPGATVSEVSAAIRVAVDGVDVHSGTTIELAGQVRQQQNAFEPLLLALLLAPVLIYLLLAGLYESLVLPFTVLLALPLASVGALAALALRDQTLNIFSLIGLLLLTGLVSKNAILLVDYTETLRRRGLDRLDALVEAAAVRLRPILMTTLTVVIALLPIAFGSGDGSETRSPTAMVLVGGLVTSTLLTLVVVPTLYTYLDAARDRLRRRGRPQPAGAVPR
jgi:HAE1 family hydrophobic/amphiphilic exporter-1